MSDRAGNLGLLLVTIRLLWSRTGTLTSPPEVAYEPITGVMGLTDLKLPIFDDGVTLDSLPN